MTAGTPGSLLTALLTIRDAATPEAGLMAGVDTWSALVEELQKIAGDAVAGCDSAEGAGEWRSVPERPTDAQTIPALEWSLEWMRAHNVDDLSPFKDYPPVKDTIKGMYAAMLAAASAPPKPAPPVPPADGALETNAEIANRMQETYTVNGDRWFKLAADRLRALSPSATGAAEPGGYREETQPCAICHSFPPICPGHAAPPVRGYREPWREQWFGFEPQRGWSIVEGRNVVAYIGGDETMSQAVTAIVAAHNAALPVQLGAGEREAARILRGWAKAYRDTPEHRFPSDPNAEFFPVDLENAADLLASSSEG